MKDSETKPGRSLTPAIIQGHGGAMSWLTGWVACIFIAWVHMALLNTSLFYADEAGTWPMVALALFVMAFPGIVSAIWIPEARRGAWRWLILIMLMNSTVLSAVMIVGVLGEATLLRRFWVSHRRYGFHWAPLPTPDGGSPKSPRPGRPKGPGLTRVEKTGDAHPQEPNRWRSRGRPAATGRTGASKRKNQRARTNA